LTKYLYHDIDLPMRNNKPSKMRELRKTQNPPLTLKELARKAGVSYTTVWNLENGQEEKVDPEIKHKVARVLGGDATVLFPSEATRVRIDPLASKIGRAFDDIYAQLEERFPIKEVRSLMKKAGIPTGGYYRLNTLMDFCPNLEFKYELDVENILRQMTPKELGNLYHSGLTPEDAVKHLNRAAKRLELRAVELKK
jgi:DNA-binding XRE family transcriptional regulator